ncbi:MAG TPA: apolipoprotein N-acyltransferase [Trebonia sp.]|nr:apolipoprotein N-acyltransferase [Trebonia sp.]
MQRSGQVLGTLPRSEKRRPFRYPGRWAAMIAACVAVLLVFPDVSLSYAAWFGLVPAIVLFARADSAREALARGWWFGAGYLITMLFWMAPEIGPGLVLIGLVAGVTWSPFAVFARLLLQPGDRAWQRFGLALVVLPATWLIPEWVRSYQGLGGPWDLYGASQWQHPAVLALAAVGGIWLVSVALVMANAGIVVLVAALVPRLLTPGAPLRPRAAATGQVPAAIGEGPAGSPVATLGPAAGARRPVLAAGGLLALIAAAGSGPLAFALTAPFPAVRTVTVALVQPGVVANATQRVDASETLTASLSKAGSLSGVKPDLIVWGESSIAEDLTLRSNAALLRRLEGLSAQDGAEILVSQDATPPGKGHEKWSVLVAPAGIKGIYVKSRLVPFGEYIPFRQQLSWLTEISNAASSNMDPGPGARVLTMTDRQGRALPVGVLVCFESAFPDMSRVDADHGAQLIVYQSSTVTFQGTWGPDQHASLAAIRAAETGRPVVQTALTGDTVAFDARGRELAWLGQSGHGVVPVTVHLPAGTARTIYDQAGDYVLWSGVAISALALLILGIGGTRRRNFLANTTGADDGRAAQYDPGTGQPVTG